MLAGIWRGVTEASKTEEYLEYLMKTGVRDSRAVSRNRGVEVLHRTYEVATKL